MKKHLLIVDDEAPIRELLARCLIDQGYRVTAVASAGEAHAAVAQEAPDLIISDLQLEDADGLEMIARLKTAVPTAPVILLTGVLFDPQVAQEILRRNVSCYLEKTVPLAKIVETVRTLLASGSPPAAID